MLTISRILRTTTKRGWFWNGGDDMASILAKILDGEITSEDLTDPRQTHGNEVTYILLT